MHTKKKKSPVKTHNEPAGIKPYTAMEGAPPQAELVKEMANNRLKPRKRASHFVRCVCIFILLCWQRRAKKTTMHK